VNARPRAGMLLQGGFSTGRTIADVCEIREQLPELTITPNPLFGNAGQLNPTSPYCRSNSGWVTQYKFLGSYTVPRLDVQVSGTFQGLPGPGLASNYTATNAVVQPSLGRPLSGGAPNVTVSLVEPGSMYGERLNQLDLRIGKIFRFGGTRTNVGLDLFNALNANPVLSENSNFAAWRTPLGILQPRYARISAQFDF
jgi:hypothetical protein